MGLTPGSGRSPGEGNGNPLQYSWPDFSLRQEDRGATVHGVAEESRHSDLATEPSHTGHRSLLLGRQRPLSQCALLPRCARAPFTVPRRNSGSRSLLTGNI